MAYAPADSTTPNPPVLVVQPIAAARQWRYVSTHTQVTVGTSDFISDGKALGMKVGDSVLVVESTAYKTSLHSVNAVGSTYIGLTTGLLISSAS